MGGFPSHDAAGFIFTTAVQPLYAAGAGSSLTGMAGSTGTATGTAPAATAPGAAAGAGGSGSGGGNRSTTTSAHAPGTGPVEICLIPLFRRYFNDNNKKLKEAVSNLYINRDSNGNGNGNGGAAAAGQKRSAPGAAAPTWASIHTVNSGSIHDSPMMLARPAPFTIEHLLGDVEASFYANGGVMLQAEPLAHFKSDLIKDARERKRNELNEALFSVGWGGKLSAAKDGDAAHDVDSPIPPKPPGGAERPGNDVGRATTAEIAAGLARVADMRSAPVLRPVPCAVCIIEPEGGGRGRGGNHHVHNAPLLVNGVPISDWITVQGRKVHCIGYLSCFATQSDAYTAQAAAGASPSNLDEPFTSLGSHQRYHSSSETHSPREFTVTSPQTSSGTNTGSPGAPTPQHQRILDVDEKGLNVYLELILEHEESFSYMVEPIVLLACMSFRSQFMTCSMWQQSFWSTTVEEAYYHHLQLLNVHVRIRKTQYARLKSLYQQFPLMELVDDLGFSERMQAGQSATQQDGEAEQRQDSVNGGASSGGKDTITTEPNGDHGDDNDDDHKPNRAGEAEKERKDDEDDDDDDEEDEEEEDGGETDGAPKADQDGHEEGSNAGDAASTADGERGDAEEDDHHPKRSASTTADKPATETANSISAPSRRNRSHRNRRRQRRVRVSLDRDQIYRETISTLPTFHLYQDKAAHGGVLGSADGTMLLAHNRSGSSTPGAQSDSSDQCSVESADGVELRFEGGILARLTKFIAETASYETVKSNYVRCDMGPLMKERRHLMAAHREALQEYLDHQEEEERLFGSEKIVMALQQWIKEGKRLEEQRRLLPEPAKPTGAPAARQPAVVVPGATVATAAPSASPASPGGSVPMMMYAPGYGLVNVMMPGGGASPSVVQPAAQPTQMMFVQPQAVAQPQPQQYFVGPNGQLMMAVPSAPTPTAFYSPYQTASVIQTAMQAPSQASTPMQQSSRPATPPQQQQQQSKSAAQPATAIQLQQQQQQQQQAQIQQQVLLQQAQQQAHLQALYAQQQAQQQHIYQVSQQVAQPQPQSYTYMMGPGGQLVLVPISQPVVAQAQPGITTVRLPQGLPANLNPLQIQQLIAQQQQQQQQQQAQQQLAQQQQVQQQQRSGSKPSTPSFHPDPAVPSADGAHGTAAMPTIKVGGVVLPPEGINAQAPIPQSATAPPPSYAASAAGFMSVPATGTSPSPQIQQGGGTALARPGGDVGSSGVAEPKRGGGNVQDLLAAAIGRRSQADVRSSATPASGGGWSVTPGNATSASAAKPTTVFPAPNATALTGLIAGLQIGGGAAAAAAAASRTSASAGSSDDYHRRPQSHSAFFDTEDEDEQAAALEAATAAIRAIEGNDVLFGMPDAEDRESSRSSDDNGSNGEQRLNDDFFF